MCVLSLVGLSLFEFNKGFSLAEAPTGVSPDRFSPAFGKSFHLQTLKSHQSTNIIGLRYLFNIIKFKITLNSQKYCQSSHTSKYNNNTYI